MKFLKGCLTAMLCVSMLFSSVVVNSSAEDTTMNPADEYFEHEYIQRYSNDYYYLHSNNATSEGKQTKFNYNVVSQKNGDIIITVQVYEKMNLFNQFKTVWFNDDYFDYSVESLATDKNNTSLNYVKNYDTPDGYNLGIDVVCQSSSYFYYNPGDCFKITLRPKRAYPDGTLIKVYNSNLVFASDGSFEATRNEIKMLSDLDVNLDGAVNAVDAAIILRIAAAIGAGYTVDVDEYIGLKGDVIE